MQIKKTLLWMAMAMIGLGAHPVLADITIGNADTMNCYPFSCAATDGVQTYQQVYSAASFSNPTTFNQIHFFQGSPGAIDSATYSISFSYTPLAVNGLSGGDPSDNIGSGSKQFGKFSLGRSMPGVLTLTGNEFAYDPANGNLLMTVDISDLTQSAGYSSYFQADESGTATSRAYFGGNGRGSDSVGLVTSFSNTVTATPEPSSMALLGSLLVLGALAARKFHPTLRTSPAK